MKTILALALTVLVSTVPARAQDSTKPRLGDDFAKATLDALVAIDAFHGDMLRNPTANAAAKAAISTAMSKAKIEKTNATEQAAYSAMLELWGDADVSGKQKSDSCISGVSAQLHARTWTAVPESCKAKQ